MKVKKRGNINDFWYSYTFKYEILGREEEELALAAEMGVARMNIVGFDKPRRLSTP